MTLYHPAIARIVTSIASIVAVIVALALPSTYFVVRYAALASEVQARAEVGAEFVGEYVNFNPYLWMFQTVRLKEAISRHPSGDAPDAVRIVDAQGLVVAATDRPWPRLGIVRGAPLFDSGIVVGHLQVAHSLTDIIVGTLIAAAGGLALAAAVFASLRILPLRALRRVVDELEHEKERALVTLHSIGDAVVTTDAHGRIEYLNPVAERLTGWSAAQARGRALPEVLNLVNEITHESVESPLPRAMGERRIVPLSNHTSLMQRGGGIIAIDDTAAPILNRDGTLAGGVLVFHDVSAARKLADQLSWQATHDALTGLINRQEFDRQLEHHLASARSEKKVHALCYIDLDQFKVVNDTCGHFAGDQLLKQLSVLFQSLVRESDTLARLGGDEFAVILDTCQLDKAQVIANNLLKGLHQFRFMWLDKVFAINASMGLVAITAGSPSAQHLLSTADTACYSAKEAGRNRVHVFEPDDTEFLARHEQMDWISRLTQALESDSFVLYGQPYLTLADDLKEEPHIEVLLRLVDGDGQTIPPGSFIPAAERYNLMPSLDRWVVAHAFREYTSLASRLGEKVVIAINLSGTSISDNTFADFILRQAKLADIPANAFCFEITETAAINQLGHAAQFIARLRQAGFRLALDDFGSGMSSFGYLKNLPVNYLKIDGTFVKDIASDPVSRTMVAAINDIGHTMGIRTIAEFVDRPDVLAELRLMGVDFAQGYLISQPVPLDQIGLEDNPQFARSV